MKIGTLTCRLFGHKAVQYHQGWHERIWNEITFTFEESWNEPQYEKLDFCIRCGKEKDEK